MLQLFAVGKTLKNKQTYIVLLKITIKEIDENVCIDLVGWWTYGVL